MFWFKKIWYVIWYKYEVYTQSQKPEEVRGIFFFNKHNIRKTWVSHSNVTDPKEISADLSTRRWTGQQAQEAIPVSLPHSPTQGK